MTIEKFLQSAFANKSRPPPLCAVCSLVLCSHAARAVQPLEQGQAVRAVGQSEAGSSAARFEKPRRTGWDKSVFYKCVAAIAKACIQS